MFDPAIAKLAKEYRTHIVGDAYAGNWVSGAFRDAGIEHMTSPKPRIGAPSQHKQLYDSSAAF
jgi:hypothetical protein